MLSRIRVLDLTNLLPGPFCTLILANLGAEVIKIEAPTGDPLRYIEPKINGIGELFISLNQGKKLITLDLKQELGQQVLDDLVKNADVLVEGFRPSTAKKLGLSFDRLIKVNPNIIHVSITGFGYGSPYENRPAHDLNYLGYTGILEQFKGSLPTVQLADIGGGSLWAIIAILATLLEKEGSSNWKGRHLDVSIVDQTFSWLRTINGISGLIKADQKTKGLRLDGKEPWYRIYEAKDGKKITLACIEDKFWESFCREIERPDLIPHKNHERLGQELRKIFKTRSRDEWVEKLAEKTCVGPVLSFAEIRNDSHIVARRLLVESNNLLLPRVLGSKDRERRIH